MASSEAVMTKKIQVCPGLGGAVEICFYLQRVGVEGSG